MGAETVSGAVHQFAPNPLELPDQATVDRAISDYAHAIREAYGPRVKGIYLFGSRARGDHDPTSDADIAVVLEDGDWRVWPEMKRLTHLAYEFMVRTGTELEAWPIRESEWSNPAVHENPPLVEEIRREAQQISSANA